MANTIPFVSSRRTIREIQATDHPPVKAETKLGRKLQALFPKPDLEADPERGEEVRRFYFPLLSRLSDRDLLAELKYLARLFQRKNDVVYSGDTPLGNFLDQTKRLLHKIDKDEHPDKINQHMRQAVVRACVYIRWNIVPLWPGPPISGESRPRQNGSPRHLYRESDWHVAQLLASRVGSCNIAPHELSFMARSWRAAWDNGPEKFSFESPGHRDWAEKLHTSLMEREPVIFYEQAKRFKEMIGFLTKIPVWRKNPVQVNLSILPYAVIVPKLEQVEQAIVPCPAEFGDLLSVPELGDKIGGNFQYRLFDSPREEVKWDGSAVQIEIRF